jgi:hypothetical protein
MLHLEVNSEAKRGFDDYFLNQTFIGEIKFLMC